MIGKREYLIVDDYVDEEAITVEKLRAWIASCKRSARAAILENIDEHGSAYCAELRAAVGCSMTVPQIREVLQELQREGTLSPMLVDPPFEDAPNAQWQRRYYFRQEPK